MYDPLIPGGCIEQMLDGAAYPHKFQKTKRGVNTQKIGHIRKTDREKVSK